MLSIAETAILLAPSTLLVMFLPALFELTKPKDEGPRRIMYDFVNKQIPLIRLDSLVDLEESHELDFSVKPFLEVILGALPTLDG
jgi:hypothetical protein